MFHNKKKGKLIRKVEFAGRVDSTLCQVSNAKREAMLWKATIIIIVASVANSKAPES